MSNPVLYILLRQDMASMTPGRTAAMASHATSVFDKEIIQLRIDDAREEMCAWLRANNTITSKACKDLEGEFAPPENPQREYLLGLYADWSLQASGFGTAIVLQADIPQIEQIIEEAQEMNLLAQAFRDPDYLIRDGRAVHSLDLPIGGYVFGEKDQLRELLGELPLLGS